MAQKKQKKPVLHTPLGVFKYCHLNKADFGTDDYPKKDGEYSVTVAFDKDDPQFKAFKAKIDGLMSEAETKAQEEFDAQTSPKVLQMWKKKGIDSPTLMPFFLDELDGDGDPTGRVTVKFKTKAQFKTKDGEIVKKTVPLIDAFGETIPAKKRPLVYAGTKGRVAFTTNVAFIPLSAEAYLTAYLSEVQIAKLVSTGGGGTSFGALEDAEFSADDLEEYEDTSTDDSEADEDDDDLDDEIPF